MNGAVGDWDEESTKELFLAEPGVYQEGIFFLTAGSEYVATATDKHLPEPDTGYLHMVAVAAGHRGKGLGRWISVGALMHMRDRGCRQAILETDDYRLPAIRTYLRLGFEPDMVEVDHPERWHEIVVKLTTP